MEATTMEELFNLFNLIVNQYASLQKTMHIQMTDDQVSLAEIHTIVCIGKHPFINAVTLAKAQGVTRSSITQMTKTLEKKRFIRKEISPQTKNEVVLSLTSKGETVFELHEKQHQYLRSRIQKKLEKYPKDTLQTLMSLGKDIQDVWAELKNGKGCSYHV